MNQNLVIKLTNTNNEKILIGVSSIISIERNENRGFTMIYSRHAMAITNYVLESVEEIYSLINNTHENTNK